MSENFKDKTNKTKDAVAVALGYDPQSGAPPRVVAGGRGKIAEQILEIAFANGVKVREDADLAELLSAIDLDDEIPIEAFAAVAEILIYVYRANGNWPSFLDTPSPDIQDEQRGNNQTEPNNSNNTAMNTGMNTDINPNINPGINPDLNDGNDSK